MTITGTVAAHISQKVSTLLRKIMVLHNIINSILYYCVYYLVCLYNIYYTAIILFL